MATKFSRMVATKKEILTEAFIAIGYTKDRWGHLKRDAQSNDGKIRTYRIVFKPRVIRREVRCDDDWIMLASATWKDAEVVDGKVKGFKRNTFLF
jgi:hypothetical protein